MKISLRLVVGGSCAEENEDFSQTGSLSECHFMIMPGVDDDAIRNTGGQVDDLAMAMIDAAYDREADCRDQICDALFDLGKKRPALVLSSAYSYLKKHNKLQTGHRVVLLQCMERIIKETLSELEPPLAVDVIKQAAMELTVSKEVMPEWQTAASGVLFPWEPDFVMKLWMKLYGMVPHLTAVLGTMLPMLGMAKHENMRWVFSSARSFSGKLTGILLSSWRGNEKMKIGMLTVFKHLINAATESMQDKQEVVVSGLKMMLSEQNNKVEKVFAQVVIAMASWISRIGRRTTNDRVHH
ncbi:unnamed protein product [Mytilus edulis]|uniref:MROH2B-like N-terminal HEAT-repeats domain-containing protein n=1 Tax=Mytilus edulis TaxID=6550 RepID=A0A8S3TMX9_MYTED|nr:unnamed protein product [Mytilus edulis]